jgi:HK97 family phage major capsid protein
MNTLHPDFLAFRSRLLAAAAVGLTYERRDTSGLAATLDQIADGFEKHKAATGARVAELEATVDQLQTKLARPGLTPPAGASNAFVPAAETRAKWTVDGKPAPVLHGAEEIRQHFAARAASGRGSAPAVGITELVRAVAGLAASPEARAVVSVGMAGDGGHLVPEMLMTTVLEAMVPESSVLTAGAGMLPLSADAGKSFTLAAVDGIPVPAFRAENGGVAESSPTFRAITMTPRSLSVYFKVSREWLMDAVGTDTVLTMVLAQAFAKRLDLVALRGSGVAPEPAGLLSAPGVAAVTNGAAGASLATTRYSNFFTAVRQILEQDSPMPTAAIMSPRSRVVLASQLDTTGQPLQVPPMLQSLRMLSTSQLPNNLTVGASTDCSEIFVGYFPRLLYAMREQMSIQRLSEAFATNGQVGLLAHMRLDVAVTYPKSFAVVSGVRP